METKHEDRLHARNLYFGTTMSQQEIADQCKVNRKTLYLWMNEGGWRHAKYAAAHAPALLLDQYYEQLGKLNQHIATRENPWPTKDEATTIRKLTMSINHFKESTGLKQTMNIFHDFLEYLRFKEGKFEMAKEFVQPIDRFVKKMMADKNWLSYNYNTIANEEQHYEAEYAQWLKTQPDNHTSSPSERSGEAKQQTGDVILSSSKDILSPSKDILSPSKDIVSLSNDILSPSKDIPTPANGNHTSLSPGEGRGEAPQPADVILSSPKDILSPSKDIVSLSNDILSPSKDIPTPANGNHTSLSPGEGRGEAPQPTPENVISTPPKSKPATPKKVEPQPQTFWQLRQQQESARLGTNPPVKAQPYNPNSTSSPRGRSGGASYSPGTQPKGTPVPHPTQPRHLTTQDIQKMMETPQPGQQPNNFNPKRY